MITYPIEDISTTVDRYKIYILQCASENLDNHITSLQSQNISIINIGKEIANYIHSLNDLKYLNIDVYDFVRTLLENEKRQKNAQGNDVVAIYNLGILLEPSLEIKTEQLLKDFSKTTSLIIVWPYQIGLSNRLSWYTQMQNYFLDFSDITLKKLEYAI